MAVELKPGDRVLVIGAGHPNRGKTGVITDEFRPDLDLRWDVALDDTWGNCGASDKDLRRLNR